MRRSARLAAGLAGFLLVLAPARADEDAAAPIIPLATDVRAALAPLGESTVGAALPAAPIRDPAALRDLTPGTWTYRIVAGANRGQVQTVRVERAGPDDPDATWRVVADDGDVQRLRVTTEHEVLKLSQRDAQSDRLVVYRPGLVLDPDMRAGEEKTITRRIATYKGVRADRVEYDGTLEYTARYIGAYEVQTPGGRFDARLIEHRYAMTIGPATARHRSYGFYADGTGNVAEVSEESVSALLLYRRSSRSARVLLTQPPR